MPCWFYDAKELQFWVIFNFPTEIIKSSDFLKILKSMFKLFLYFKKKNVQAFPILMLYYFKIRSQAFTKWDKMNIEKILN